MTALANEQLSLLDPSKDSCPHRPLRFSLDLDAVKDKAYLTHNFHPYPAKFIPQIPGAILDTYAVAKSVVVDPFCGSGTVAVEAALRGHDCLVSDINPIATLITRAKVCRLTPDDRVQISELLIRLRERDREKKPEQPAFKNRDHWFTPQMTEELSVIRRAVLCLPQASCVRTLGLAAFSAILVKCSLQESETRWVAISKKFSPRFAFRCFEEKLLDMSRRSAGFAQVASGTVNVFEADARSLHYAARESADIVLTSPPYLNSYDYYLYHKLRMFWLGYDHYAIQRAEVGSRHRHCDLHEPVEGYVSAMAACFSEIKRILRPKGIAAIVIGDSIYQGKLIDAAEMYNKLARSDGFALIDRFDYDQRKYTLAFNKAFKKVPKKTHALVFSRG